MEIFDSSPYVIERARRLAPYFAKRGWTVASGKNNSILINISQEGIIAFDAERFANIIIEADLHIEETGLKTNDIEYVFFRQGKHFGTLIIQDVREFDIWEE
jgi:hypothetical protein